MPRRREASYRGHQDTPPLRTGRSTCCASTFWAWPAREPFDADSSMARCAAAASIASSNGQCSRRWHFVSTGGYALKGYERYAKLRPLGDGR